MTKYLKQLIVFTIIILAVCLPIIVSAQPIDPGVPLDGGVSIVLAAAGVMGVKKMIANRKKKKDKNAI